MLTKTVERVWRTRTRYDRESPRGSGYCADQWVEEREVTRWRLFGVPVWFRDLLVREVPPHEWIATATLGGFL